MTYQEFVFDRPIGRVRRTAPEASALHGGSMRGLAFALEWTGPGLEGSLSFAIGNEQVWSTGGTPLAKELWLKMLEGLARAWVHILLEETYPRGISVDRPSLAEEALIVKLYNIDDARSEAASFRNRHDLGTWITPSRSLPSLWLVREGNLMVLESAAGVTRWAYSDVVRTLREVGDHIAERARSEPATSAEVQLWEDREGLSDARLEQISLAMSPEKLERLQGSFPLRRRSEIFRGADEVRAAARMLVDRVGDADLNHILERIRSAPFCHAPLLTEWSQKACGQLELVSDELPRIQGRHIARWLRSQIDNVDERINPEEMLQQWGVPVEPFSTVRNIEAIAFWGDAHGPAILLNSKSRRGGGWHARGLSGGRRFTLAHELAHLLLDTEGSLPVGEVLGGAVPKAPEERANAFAAELLLPENTAGVIYQRSPDLQQTIQELTGQFGVTRTLVAWQLLKRFGDSSPVLSAKGLSDLRMIVR